jgi:large subunit ribosomal protein L11
MQIKLLVEGGNMQPGPALSQKLGPTGINVGQVLQKVNEATSDFKGMKVPVEVDIEPSTKAIDVKVFSPPVGELLKKELAVEKGSGAQKKIKIANASIEQIIGIAKTKLPNMLSKDLKAAVKSVLGSCVSLGILVENKSPKEVIQELEEGKYDREISEEKIETPEEKKKKLEEYFLEIKTEQDRILKQEEAAKAAEAAAAQEAVTAPGEEAKTTETEEKEEKKKK